MNKNRVCPVEMAGSLDNKIRRWVQNPNKILKPYIKDGMTVLDLGCGPGFFTIDMAWLVGETGRVIGADLQPGMLDKLNAKISGTELENRIHLHTCEKNSIGITEQVDFILAFYMIHELPDQEIFFNEIAAMLNPKGLMLIVEPSFHVSKKAFAQMVEKAEQAGLASEKGPNIFFSRAVIMQKQIIS